MATIKKLKSGTTPCSDSGNSVLPDDAANLTLNWGGLMVTPQIQAQANATRGVVIKKTGS